MRISGCGAYPWELRYIPMENIKITLKKRVSLALIGENCYDETVSRQYPTKYRGRFFYEQKNN